MKLPPQILVIDDDKEMLELLATLFGGITGNDVVTACGGLEGMNMFTANPPDHFDIITLDMQMPDIDGVKLVRMLAEGHFRGTLALLSGMEKELLTAVEALARDYKLKVLGSVKKPVSHADLQALVERYREIREELAEEDQQVHVTAAEFEEALDNNQFYLGYQPKISTHTRRVEALEALCRWLHPEKGLIPPNVFVPVAEQSGLIKKLTRWVIDKSFSEIRLLHWFEADIDLALNVSMEDLTDLDLPDYLQQKAADFNMDLNKLILEVTETRLLDDMKLATEVLARMRLLGVKLSIDDFGTGYSSVEKLRRMPFSELKIDKMFVAGMNTDKRLHGIFESNIFLSKKLEMKSVAEGVESHEDWELVVAAGCDLVQGYLVARPMPMGELMVWITNWHKKLGK